MKPKGKKPKGVVEVSGQPDKWYVSRANIARGKKIHTYDNVTAAALASDLAVLLNHKLKNGDTTVKDSFLNLPVHSVNFMDYFIQKDLLTDPMKVDKICSSLASAVDSFLSRLPPCFSLSNNNPPSHFFVFSVEGLSLPIKHIFKNIVASHINPCLIPGLDAIVQAHQDEAFVLPRPTKRLRTEEDDITVPADPLSLGGAPMTGSLPNANPVSATPTGAHDVRDPSKGKAPAVENDGDDDDSDEVDAEYVQPAQDEDEEDDDDEDDDDDDDDESATATTENTQGGNKRKRGGRKARQEQSEDAEKRGKRPILMKNQPMLTLEVETKSREESAMVSKHVHFAHDCVCHSVKSVIDCIQNGFPLLTGYGGETPSVHNNWNLPQCVIDLILSTQMS